MNKKKYFSIAIIIIAILIIFLGAYCFQNFFYNLIDEIDLKKINETDKKSLVEHFIGISIGCFVGALISKMFMILEKKELNK